MIKVINAILFLVCIALAVLLAKSLLDPMNIKKQIDSKENAVHQRLYEVRDAQEAMKSSKGHYAPTFDSLKKVLKTDSFRVKNFQTGDVKVTSILDSLYKGDVAKVDRLSQIPGANGKEFALNAGFLDNPNDSTIQIPTFEVSTLNTTYLDGVNPDYWFKDQKVKLGSMTAPILRGNWE